ncbi:T9SS type A sorting domain-containing protein [Flavobacterium sp. SM15]|uniref:T9SS type A sorting domain-containing protein n=1 Tax=Flavobacterium sp. SM15 TaxID=2908005 RepID=UPI001EDA0699|nr:T9SS type A sorting domain-containing protein [Flavobacterium sp. SM15]MCG2612039.1 T9SS type A sorting domain-containing protein [Flavobacterium sp. SM15]
MKRITLFCFMLVSCLSFGQVVLTQNFDGGTSMPAGWTETGGKTISASESCAGNSIRGNLYGFSTTGTLTSPNQVAVSNATDMTVSFDYKIENWNSTTATPAGWGNIQVQYSVDNGTAWTTFFTIDDANHTVANTCATKTATVPGASLPMSSDIMLRFLFTWVGGDYDVYIDNFSAVQVLSNVPSCSTNAVAAPNASCGNYAVPLTWDASAEAMGYKLTIGTTPGGTEVLNNSDLGSATSYNLTLPAIGTMYYWKVVPYNAIGDAVGCTENTFSTAGSGCYCTSNPTSNDNSGITNVQIGTTDFPTTDVTYFDHSATTVDLARGINANTQISFATGYTYDTNIWIDFNDNYTFEASEIVYHGESLAPNPTVLNASYTMPIGAALGIHKMRIVASDNAQIPADPCYSDSYGVTLDFSVNIVEASCTPLAATTSMVADCFGDMFFVDVNITDLGNGVDPYISDGTDAWPIFSTGVTQVGPWAFGTPVTLTLYHGGDATCNVSLGTFNYLACPPANDECSGAIALTVNADFSCATVTAGSTTAATQSSQTDDVTGTPERDVWYSFVAAATAHRISLTDVTSVVGTSEDMGIGLYNGTGGCAALTLVGSSDPETYDVSGLTVGNTYYVRVYAWDGGNDQMSFNVCVGTPPPPPANDVCANATEISSLPYNNAQDASSATNNSGFVSSCGGANDGVWYTFTVDTPGDVSVALTNVAGWDPKVAVYSGSCGTFTCVDSVDDSGTGGSETLDLTALAAGQYWINIGYYSGSFDSQEGPFTLDVTGTATLGAESFDVASFKVYPNPVKDILNITYSSDITSVEVYNMLGQNVITKSINATLGQIDMSNLTSGNYIVKVTSDGMTKSIKVVKQ